MIEKITITKALPSDSAEISSLILLAMEDIVYKFIGKENHDEAFQFIFHFAAERNNQYSFENCLIAKVHNEIAGVINFYDGSKYLELKKPVVTYLQTNFPNGYIPENETQPGEIYIDALAVRTDFQGQRIGTQLLRYLINEYIRDKEMVIGLLVDPENPKAQKLYLDLGFKKVGIKKLTGKLMEHLQHKN